LQCDALQREAVRRSKSKI